MNWDGDRNEEIATIKDCSITKADVLHSFNDPVKSSAVLDVFRICFNALFSFISDKINLLFQFCMNVEHNDCSFRNCEVSMPESINKMIMIILSRRLWKIFKFLKFIVSKKTLLV